MGGAHGRFVGEEDTYAVGCGLNCCDWDSGVDEIGGVVGEEVCSGSCVGHNW